MSTARPGDRNAVKHRLPDRQSVEHRGRAVAQHSVGSEERPGTGDELPVLGEVVLRRLRGPRAMTYQRALAEFERPGQLPLVGPSRPQLARPQNIHAAIAAQAGRVRQSGQHIDNNRTTPSRRATLAASAQFAAEARICRGYFGGKCHFRRRIRRERPADGTGADDGRDGRGRRPGGKRPNRRRTG